MDVIGDAVQAIECRDWRRLKALLHPYLHWTGADGRTIRGRKNVLAHLERAPTGGPPAAHELRDEQVYRWVEGPDGRSPS